MDQPDQKLQQLRARIDETDEALARLLIDRIKIIREVAALKAANWPKSCHIRPGREGQMHRAIAKRFTDTGFPPLMALAIWRQLIGGSTHLESPLNIAYLAEFPEHRFLAREYFGVQIGASAAATLTDTLALAQNGTANILILPTAQNHRWWREAKTLHDAGFYIFSALPVEENNLPQGTVAALGLAAVMPEDSGDDISYFLQPDGTVRVLDGFHTTHENALFLGAHPRPIRLTSGVMYA